MDKQEKIIGRLKEQSLIKEYMISSKAELIAVYGRRRVGKTFLIRRYFNDSFDFYFTGTFNAPKSTQLRLFQIELQRYSGLKRNKPTDWFDAFDQLRDYLSKIKKDRIIVLLDELPWMDTPRSNFLQAFSYFWNSWGCTADNLKLFVCGSATTWMLSKLIGDKGGLHGRVNRQLYLRPFNLEETEKFLKFKGINWTRYQIAQVYMAMGGIPYYLDMLEPSMTVNENIDKSDTELLKVDFDYENGVLCYDVSFHKYEEDLNYDYDYNIDALTGEMISFEKELDNPEVLVVSENMQLKKTEEEAKAEAFEFAGKNEADIFAYEMEIDEKKVPHYDVEFKSEGMEYNYSVGLYHDVLFKMKWEKEEGGLTDKMYEPSEEEKLKFIGEEKAKQIAFQTAGVLEGELYGLEVEIEKDRKGIVYEVEFKSGIYSYSYDVDSVTGEIVDYEIDYSNK